MVNSQTLTTKTQRRVQVKLEMQKKKNPSLCILAVSLFSPTLPTLLPKTVDPVCAHTHRHIRT